MMPTDAWNDDRWEPVPVPPGDGRHDIGDDVRAAIVLRLISDWSRDPDLTPKKVRELAMWAGASVRALLHELGTLRDFADTPADAAESPRSRDQWEPIETAPERRKVLVTWINALGHRRTALASYWPVGTLDLADDVPDWQVSEDGRNLDAGWWEESEGNDDVMFRLVEPMTHWRALPAPPHVEKSTETETKL